MKRTTLLLAAAAFGLASCGGSEKPPVPSNFTKTDVATVRAAFLARENHPYAGFTYEIRGTGVDKTEPETGTVRLSEAWPDGGEFPLTKEACILTDETYFDDLGGTYYRNDAGHTWIDFDLIEQEFDQYFCTTFYYLTFMGVKSSITLTWFE